MSNYISVGWKKALIRILGLLLLLISSALRPSRAEDQPIYWPELDWTKSSAGPTVSFIEFVVDASSNMAKALDGKPKFEIVKNVMEKALGRLASITARQPVHVGLRIIGGSSSQSSCQDSKLVYAPGPERLPNMIPILQSLQPQGSAPIAYALRQAVKDFPKGFKATKSIILITDGQESCEKNICQMTWDLSKEVKNLKVHVIGLDLTPRTAQIIGCMARMTGGKMALAGDAMRLEEVLNHAITESVSNVSWQKDSNSGPKKWSWRAISSSSSAFSQENYSLGQTPPPPVESPWLAGGLSLIIPGAGQVGLHQADDAGAVIATESVLIALSNELRERYRREAKKDFALPGFYMDTINTAIASEWLAQSVAAALAAKSRQNLQAPEFKSSAKAATLSLLWPGLGDVYVGKNMAMGLTMMGMSVHFVSRAIYPLGAHIGGGAPWHRPFKGKSPTANEKKAFDDIRRISLFSFIALQSGSALNATVAAESPPRMYYQEERPVSPLSAGILAGMIPGAGHMALGHEQQGLFVLAVQGGSLYGLNNWKQTHIEPYKAPARKDLAIRDVIAHGAGSLWASQAIAAALLAQQHKKGPETEEKNPRTALMFSLLWPGLGNLYIGDYPQVGLTAMSLSAYLLYRSIYPFGETRAIIHKDVAEPPKFFFPPKRIRPTPGQRSQYRQIRHLSLYAYVGLSLGGGLISWSAASSHNERLGRRSSNKEIKNHWTLGLWPGAEGPIFGMRVIF